MFSVKYKNEEVCMSDKNPISEIESMLEEVRNGTWEPSRYRNSDAGMERVVDLLSEIDSRTRAEREISRTLMENTPVGICITTRDGMYEFVNEAYCEIYGYGRDELLGHSFTMVVPEESRDYLMDLHDQFLGRKWELSGEWEVLRKDGSVITILANAAYLVDTSGEAKKVTYVIDISDIKESERRLKESVDALTEEKAHRERIDQSRQDMEQILRHDLRSPLNGVMGMSQLLLTSLQSGDEREYASAIYESGKKMLKMIDNSLDFMKMEHGDYQLRLDDFNLLDIFSVIQRDLSLLIERMDVRIEVVINGDLAQKDAWLHIVAERSHLENLFSNLIRNAVEASESGDVVTVSIQGAENDETYYITVHNDSAIPVEIRSSFFERYSTLGKKNGTGLGTYIAKLITETHGGSISFETSDTVGTDITVVLPRITRR